MMTVKELKEMLDTMKDTDLIYIQSEDSDFATKAYISDTKIDGKWHDILVIE